MSEKVLVTPLDIKDVFDDPNRFGIPTFEQYAKNRDFYFRHFYGHEEDILASADRGSNIRDTIVKHKYELDGYHCNSLEEVERVAKGQGIPLKSLEYRPEMIPLGGGKYEILVRFNTKDRSRSQ